MRNYLLAAVAAAALTSPAMARDKSTYVGVSGGVMLVEDTNLDYSYDVDISEVRDAVTIDHKLGFDVDVFAGYDFGLVRGEVELAYKRASIDEVQLDNPICSVDQTHRALRCNAKSAFFLGHGATSCSLRRRRRLERFPRRRLGWARVSLSLTLPRFGLAASPTAITHDCVADPSPAIRKSITPTIDLGLKYRSSCQQAQVWRQYDSNLNLRAATGRTA